MYLGKNIDERTRVSCLANDTCASLGGAKQFSSSTSCQVPHPLALKESATIKIKQGAGQFSGPAHDDLNTYFYRFLLACAPLNPCQYFQHVDGDDKVFSRPIFQLGIGMLWDQYRAFAGEASKPWALGISRHAPCTRWL